MNKIPNIRIPLMYVTLSAAISLAIFTTLFYAETTMITDLNRKIGSLDKYKGISQYMPIETIGIVRLKADKENFETLYEKMAGYHKDSDSFRLLARRGYFYKKEDIARIEGTLRSMADEAGMKMPASLGFDEYRKKDAVFNMAGELPARLYAASRIVTMALNSKVSALNDIKFGALVLKEPLSGSDSIQYEEVPINVKITASPEGWKNFLCQLSYSKDAFIVKDIDMKLVRGVIEADMTILFINFTKLD
jgi:hypothetical protein